MGEGMIRCGRVHKWAEVAPSLLTWQAYRKMKYYSRSSSSSSSSGFSKLETIAEEAVSENIDQLALMPRPNNPKPSSAQFDCLGDLLCLKESLTLTLVLSLLSSSFIMKNEEIAALLQALDLKWEQRSESQLEHLKSLLDERLAQLSSPSSPSMGGEASAIREQVPREKGRQFDAASDSCEVNSIIKTLRVKVPRFDGQNVDDWIYKINKFFNLHKVAPATRLAVVAFHLDGAPSTWFQWMEKGGSITDWDSFISALQLRFGASIYDDLLGRISKLTQTGLVSQFRAEFESLMPRISGVADSMFLNFFIWGLKLDIRRELLLAKPVDLADAMAKAQLFEDRNEDLVNRQKSEDHRSGWSTRAMTTTPFTPPASFTASKHGYTTPTITNQPPISQAGIAPLPIKKLTPAEMKDRRDKGLYYTCDEKFSYGHKCKNRMLIMCVQEEELETGTEPDGQDFDTAEEEVSLNSLSNSLNPRIFRITAKHSKESLEVLVDTGSNNNFIQEALVYQLQLFSEETKRFKVYMGNGHFLLCSKICKGFELVLQGHKFVVDLYVLPISGLEVVLGMQWLQTLGPCIHDHKELTMEFSWKGSVVKLKGSTDVSAHQLSYAQFNALLQEGDVRMLYRLSAVLEDQDMTVAALPDLEAHFPALGKGILTQYADIFTEPKELPPYRSVDHRIFLQPGSPPVNIRPYRYPHFQKDDIEKLVQEMMEMGFIRPSTSPYSSPVLLVKKRMERGDFAWIIELLTELQSKIVFLFRLLMSC
ncbi:uncharacterized protein LOC133799441 [Humulus lupulus]|uniref:uncharacterized protein LOC133799441 n=1 Tax=Humulus lupulus TaxID=3486 RepID=UPI002B40DD52|nr:uncharacterized protein LOC133799441 [Humulus lupulus]